MPKFLIEGGHPLHGTAKIHGSKNASLPILAATLLTDEPCVLHGLPDISDVHAFVEILKGLGAKAEWGSGTAQGETRGTLTIQTEKITSHEPEKEGVKQMRASILLLGPMLARAGKLTMFFPGGCVLGKRSVHAHTHALQSLGATVEESENGIEARAEKLKGAKVIMAEASVTATENALMAAVLADGRTEIHWAAMEPHVQDLGRFLNKMGAKIEGIGTPTLVVEGVKKLHGAEHAVTRDYLEVGTLSIATLLTRGEVTLEDAVPDHLDSFWEKLEEAGARFELQADAVRLLPLPKGKNFRAIDQLKTAVFPGFATDLQAPFTVLLTQAEGASRVFETLFEGRLNYLDELKKLGAKVELHNSQQATIFGPTALKGEGGSISSCDIRAGAAMVLAALVAQGKTEIHDIRYIDRGYERLDETLRGLGARVERVNDFLNAELIHNHES